MILTVCLARMTSSRLPGKLMLPLSSGTVLDLVYDKISSIGTRVIFAIPDNSENQILAEALECKKIDFCRGSEDNVLDRFLSCAQLGEEKIMHRFNCDNVLFSEEYFRQCLDVVESNYDDYDVFSNTHCQNHSGQSFEAIKLSKVTSHSSATRFEREHVFPFFYNNRGLKRLDIPCPMGNCFPLDTVEDYEAMKKILDD